MGELMGVRVGCGRVNGGEGENFRKLMMNSLPN